MKDSTFSRISKNPKKRFFFSSFYFLFCFFFMKIHKSELWKAEKPRPQCLVDGITESWAIPAMSPPISVQNPFLEEIPFVNSLKSSDFAKNPLVQLYIDDCISTKQNNDNEMKNNSLNETPFLTLNDLTNGIEFQLNEFFDEPIPKQITEQPSPKRKNKKLEYYKPFQFKKSQYFALEFEDSFCNFKIKEPIIVRTYLFDGTRVVSEHIEWFPKQCANYFVNIKHLNNSTKIAFEIQQTTPDLILIITLSHPLHINHGKSMLNYYTKPTSRHLRSAEKETKKSMVKSI